MSVEFVEQIEYEPQEVSRVRRRVAAALAEVGVPDEQCEVAVLLVSEVVTNAILHGMPPAEISVQVHDGHIQIEVSDAGAAQVAPVAEVQWDDGGGRGLMLVEALATSWGTSQRAARNQVWFQLDYEL